MSRPRGRPPKPAEERRSLYVFARVTPEEKRELEAAAKRSRLPVSRWVRRTLLRTARESDASTAPPTGRKPARRAVRGRPPSRDGERRKR